MDLGSVSAKNVDDTHEMPPQVNQRNYDKIHTNSTKTVISLKQQLQEIRLKEHATSQKYKIN